MKRPAATRSAFVKAMMAEVSSTNTSSLAINFPVSLCEGASNLSSAAYIQAVIFYTHHAIGVLLNIGAKQNSLGC